ncbi:hypothetical protein [Psychrobacter sp.]|uniref:hypothetical protein n=1 Tax=Psychrobacter sp. TaxID=56811 RepID=UPI002648DDB4|nr:hypothetical protein [Psychrobacter sp.]MDN6307724.1 hypothetical protein [Psychrobacter sp.]
MPHLHDMEELISSIEDNQVKDYMKEAMSCYMANAYRACIVLGCVDNYRKWIIVAAK